MSENLGQFGKHFQEGLMRCLLTDARWAEQISEVFKPEYFELKHLQFLSEKYFDYAAKYRVYPSMNILVPIIKEELKAKTGSDEVLGSQVIELLKKCQTTVYDSDAPYIKEKSLDWCRKMALRAAFERGIDKMASSDLNYSEIADDIKMATMVGTTPSVGHNFFEEMESRFTPLQRAPVATGIKDLDAKLILNGGLGKGELGCIVANTGVGKSHFLTFLGTNALRLGLNVLHYTFELSEFITGIRYDSNLCEIDSSDIVDRKTEVLKHYEENGKKYGKLFIKYYPTMGCTIHMLRSHIERLSTRGFKPDLILVDYADVMRSSRQYDSPRHELKLIYEELRGVAGELQVPIWTASQGNKDGASSEIVDLTNMSEAYAKAMTCDVVLSISRLSHEKSIGAGRLYVAKNRAGKDGIAYPLFIDTARSNFVVRGEQLSFDQAKADGEVDMKKALKKKWDELEQQKLVEQREKQKTEQPDASA